MFDFKLFRGRPVRVLLRDGSSYTAEFKAILDEWSESKPTIWLTDWSLEHFVTLDSVIEVEAA